MPAPLLPVLHATVAPADLLRAWHLDPPLTVLLLGVAAGYLLARRAAARAGRALPSRWRVVAFLAGLEVTAVALMGPPDHGNAVRFSVHMVQHTLLILVAAPLLALGQPVRTLVRGLPPPVLRWFIARRALIAPVTIVTHPVAVFLAVVGPFVLWHYPPLYEAALRIPTLHELEHVSFLGGAFVFWWVLLEPFPRHRRLSATTALLLVFATWMATDLVCATVTLAPRPLYRSYAETAALWGIDPLADQRLGGAIMWVGGGGLYAVVLLVLLVRAARPGTVARHPRASEPARLLFPIAVAGLSLVPLVFLSLGVIAPVMARGGNAVQWKREDPQSFERRVEAFVAAYRVGERGGRPVVAPPAGGDALLVGRADGWYPLLELQRGVEYQLVVSARDSAHGLLVDLGGQRVVVRVLPGQVAVVRIRADRAGEYPILCTELCGPAFQSMTGLVIVRE